MSGLQSEHPESDEPLPKIQEYVDTRKSKRHESQDSRRLRIDNRAKKNDQIVNLTSVRQRYG